MQPDNYFKVLIILVFSNFIPFFSSAQENVAGEQLYYKKLAIQEDTTRIKELLNLGDLYEETDTVLCKKIYSKALEISRNIANSDLEFKSLINLGILYKTHGRIGKALQYYQMAYFIAIRNHKYEDIGKALANLGNVYLIQNKPQEALKSYLEAVSYLERANNLKATSFVYGNIGNIFEQQSLYDKSIEYGKIALHYAILSKDEQTIGRAYLNISVPYYRTNNLIQHFNTCLNALKFLRHSAHPKDLLYAYQNLESHYSLMGNFDKSNLYCDSALYLARKLNLNRSIAELLIIKTGYARIKGQYIDAEHYLQESKKHVMIDGTLSVMMNYYKQMYLLYESKGDYKNALLNLERFNMFSDSLRNEKAGMNNLILEAEFQSTKKESQIVQLEKEKKIQELTLSNQNLIIYILIAGIISVILIALLYYKSNKRKNLLARQIIHLNEHQLKQMEQEKQMVATKSILQSQEAERSRMAKDLHDGLGGMLSGIKLNLSSLKGITIMQERDVQLFANSISQLDKAIAEMRRVAHSIMPEAFLKFGLCEAIQDFCDGINESRMIKLKFTHIGFPYPMEQSTVIALYRVVQELSNNAIKHAAAENIFIQLIKHPEGLSLTVEDDGTGFDTSDFSAFAGSGLNNVQMRINYLGGSWEIQSKIGIGTSVNIEILL